jgi:hypothetical protein
MSKYVSRCGMRNIGITSHASWASLVLMGIFQWSCTSTTATKRSKSQNSSSEVVGPTRKKQDKPAPDQPTPPTVPQQAVAEPPQVPTVTAAIPAPSASPSPDAATTPKSDEKPMPVDPKVPVVADCVADQKMEQFEPILVQKTKTFVTRITSPCATPTGAKGHRPQFGWIAMGVPCTGGEGRIDWKGTNYLAPKMVSFLFDTTCPMAPRDTSTLLRETNTALGYDAATKMIAFNPFMAQYWEFPDLNEADTSFNPDLRNGKSLTSAWSQFVKGKPLKLLMVGRENAWAPGNFIYVIEAELTFINKNRFTASVINARLLKGDELTAIKTRCEALRPERECQKVFL